MHELQNPVHFSKFAMSFHLIFFCLFAKFYSHATSCTPCAKAKASCKPFDTDKTHAKARAKAVWRSKVRKTKQQMDVMKEAKEMFTVISK